MYDANDFQVRYSDHRRQMTWVNDEGWKFDPPTTRKGVRAIVAQALVALAIRLSSTGRTADQSTYGTSVGTGSGPNATIA
jgi:hypothetical protein